MLNSMFSVKNGSEAWAKLNEEEQAAVMDFLTEHCGDEAQAKLEETCAMARPSRLPEWLGNFLGLAGAVAIYYALDQLSDRLASVMCPLLLFGMFVVAIFADERPSRRFALWRERESCDAGAVLDEMHRVTQMTRWQAMDKGMLVLRLILFGVLLLLCIVNLAVFHS